MITSCRKPLLFVAITLIAAGCQPKPPEKTPARIYAADQTGAAKSCDVPKPKLTTGQETTATMTVGNDGGWCGILLSDEGKPFAAGLLTTRPQHGAVFIHSVGDDTRIDYTPARGFTGSDSFAVTLLPEHTALKVAVTVAR